MRANIFLVFHPRGQWFSAKLEREKLELPKVGSGNHNLGAVTKLLSLWGLLPLMSPVSNGEPHATVVCRSVHVVISWNNSMAQMALHFLAQFTSYQEASLLLSLALQGKWKGSCGEASHTYTSAGIKSLLDRPTTVPRPFSGLRGRGEAGALDDRAHPMRGIR